MMLKLTLFALLLSPPTGDHRLENVPAPNFTLPDLKGKEVEFASIRGKVTIVNFWASWCGPCGKELPSFAVMQKKLFKKGLRVVAINLDEKVKNARKFMKKNKIRLKVLWDGHHRVAGAYAVGSMPSTYVLDKNGVIRSVHHGYTPEEFRRITAVVKDLLEE